MIHLLTAESLNVEQLRQLASPRTFAEGRQDYEQDRVSMGSVDAHSAWLSVRDHHGSQTYQVRIWAHEGQTSLTCTCQQGYSWSPCRHRIAAFLALREHLRQHPPQLWKAVIEHANQTSSRRSATTHGPVVFSLQNRSAFWAIVPYQLSAKLFSADELADLDAIAQRIDADALSMQSKPIRSRISPISYPYASTEAIAAANLSVGNPYVYGYYGREGAAFYESVFSFLPRCLVYYGEETDPLAQRLEIISDAELAAMLSEANGGIRMQLRLVAGEHVLPMRKSNTDVIVQDPLWLLVDEVLAHVPNADGFSRTLLDYPDLVVPAKDQNEFLDTYLLPVTERISVQGDLVQWESIDDVAPQPCLYLSERDGAFQAELRFSYGGYDVAYDKRPPPHSVQRKPGSAQLVRVTRQLEREQEAWQALSSFGLKRGPAAGMFLLRRGTDTVDFLLRQVPRLVEAGYTIYGEEALTSTKVNRNRPSISFNVKSGIDWFDVDAKVNYGELEVSLKDVRQAIRKRAKYIKLADGSIGMLPEEWAEKYQHLFGMGQEHDDSLRFTNSQTLLLDQLIEESDHAQTDAEFERRRAKLRSFDHIEPQELPCGFHGELRPYQKFGYDWLHFLREYHFGGCLADDMGVGKTIQALAFLQSLYEREPTLPATLLVMPRSLLFNWQREAERFTPDLKLYIQADQGRISEPEGFGEYNLILTTYGTMRRDIDLLRNYRFHYAILDESQAIKNPFAETSKAARMLQAEHRLVLTGTPVENSTTELWSQFAFLNPGLLGSFDYFQTAFATQIERHQSGDTAQLLRRMVYPFILRRTKDQVATDLPPRTERVLVSDMEPAQRKLYARQRDYYRAMLLGVLEDENIDSVRMKVLEGLLRLRQICNHPRLVDERFKGSSGKFEALIETLETLRAEGHRALIFSQFVQMLTLVREALDQRGIPYAYLDGQTRNREEVVDYFQNKDDVPFFLISLKAGGVGLNLTAADYVIHIDPWWNPAVEMQATDRTHRIGQDKPVFVYKFVTRDSVEEKILQLQDKKRALVEQVIGAEGGVFKSLTREDVEVLFS
jgi:non-specific serine/threonine protein kinase